MPPVTVPGHSSFPSGHATQAYLMAKCMQLVLLDRSQSADGASDHPQRHAVGAGQRVARNREIAGLHYPSDSQAGSALADAVFAKLSELNAGGRPRQSRPTTRSESSAVPSVRAAKDDWKLDSRGVTQSCRNLSSMRWRSCGKRTTFLPVPPPGLRPACTGDVRPSNCGHFGLPVARRLSAGSPDHIARVRISQRACPKYAGAVCGGSRRWASIRPPNISQRSGLRCRAIHGPQGGQQQLVGWLSSLRGEATGITFVEGSWTVPTVSVPTGGVAPGLPQLDLDRARRATIIPRFNTAADRNDAGHQQEHGSNNLLRLVPVVGEAYDSGGASFAQSDGDARPRDLCQPDGAQ